MRPRCSEGQGVAASQTESMGEDWIRREVARFFNPETTGLNLDELPEEQGQSSVSHRPHVD